MEMVLQNQELGADLSEVNDLNVAAKLGHIEAMLEAQNEDQRRLERRLVGEPHEVNGGVIGSHERRLTRIETWFIRVTAALAAFAFFTGSGPVSLSQLLRFFATQKP